MLLQFAKSPKAKGCDSEDGEKGEDGGEEVLPPLAVAAEAEDGRATSAFSPLASMQMRKLWRTMRMVIIFWSNLFLLLGTIAVIQGDHSGRLQPHDDLVPTVLATSGPLLQLPTAQVG